MSLTFKERVDRFWQWFPTVAERFYETIESGQCRELADEVSQYMGETLPGLAWVFGPGENGGHSFTVSGEGMVARQLLSEYWLSRQSACTGWTFYQSRQPSRSLENIAIEIQEIGRVDTDSMLIQTNVDPDHEVLDIVAWHPLFSQIPDDHHAQMLFLLLDETLGEFGTQSWIGGIEIAEVKEDGIDGRTTHRMKDLPKFINDVQRYHGWEKHSPVRSYTGYSIKSQQPVLRGDTIAGTTCIPSLVFELIEEGGRLEEDPLEGTGASLAYLQIDSAVFPSGDEAGVRYNIEDALEQTLEGEHLGRPLGGAAGTDSSYIDLLLIDGQRSRDAVDSTMGELELRGRYRWHGFT